MWMWPRPRAFGSRDGNRGRQFQGFEGHHGTPEPQHGSLAKDPGIFPLGAIPDSEPALASGTPGEARIGMWSSKENPSSLNDSLEKSRRPPGTEFPEGLVIPKSRLLRMESPSITGASLLPGKPELLPCDPVCPTPAAFPKAPFPGCSHGAIPGMIPMIPGMNPAIPGTIPAIPGTIQMIPAIPGTISANLEIIPMIPEIIPEIPGMIPVIPVTIPAIPGIIPMIPGMIPAIPGTIPAIPGTIPMIPETIPEIPGIP